MKPEIAVYAAWWLKATAMEKLGQVQILALDPEVFKTSI